MSYVYADERPRLFTEEGVEMLTAIRRNVARALKVAGAVRAQEAMAGVCGNSWLQLAVFDYMVEKNELIEVTDPDKVWSQHRIFRAPNSW
jgi:hypothetical protein